MNTKSSDSRDVDAGRRPLARVGVSLLSRELLGVATVCPSFLAAKADKGVRLLVDFGVFLDFEVGLAASSSVSPSPSLSLSVSSSCCKLST